LLQIGGGIQNMPKRDLLRNTISDTHNSPGLQPIRFDSFHNSSVCSTLIVTIRRRGNDCRDKQYRAILAATRHMGARTYWASDKRHTAGAQPTTILSLAHPTTHVLPGDKICSLNENTYCQRSFAASQRQQNQL
jgi:hypothetical protein